LQLLGGLKLAQHRLAKTHPADASGPDFGGLSLAPGRASSFGGQLHVRGQPLRHHLRRRSGGLGSITGALIGALLVGLAANHTGFLVPKVSQFSNVALPAKPPRPCATGDRARWW